MNFRNLIHYLQSYLWWKFEIKASFYASFFAFYLLIIIKMKYYIDLLKKCRTFKGASSVYIACLLDEKLKNSEKNDFQTVYCEFVRNTKLK